MLDVLDREQNVASKCERELVEKTFFMKQYVSAVFWLLVSVMRREIENVDLVCSQRSVG